MKFDRSKYHTIIGIDPGTKTGLAICTNHGKCISLHTLPILKAIEAVKSFHPDGVLIRLEDPRQSGGSRARAQGAGSVKRDAAIWREFAKENGFDLEDCRLSKFIKLTPEKWAKMGFDVPKKASSHSLDAFCYVLPFLASPHFVYLEDGR